MPRIELQQSKKDGDWYFAFFADNGKEITRSSEGYNNRMDAINAAILAHPGIDFEDWTEEDIADEREGAEAT